MRPLRSISRKNSVQKSLDTSAESRLLSSFSKIGSKNNEKQSFVNLSQISIQNHKFQCGKLLKQRQSFNNSCQSSLYTSQSNSPKINRISMTTEQKLQQKQNIIQHLKIQLQQSRYIISSLKQQLKQLNFQLLSQNKKADDIKCQKCNLLQSKMAQLDFLKAKQLKDDQFLSTYQELIQKLTYKINQLETQNKLLKTKNHQKSIKDPQQSFITSTNSKLSYQQCQQLPLRQNKNFFNRIQLNCESEQFTKSRCSFDLRLQSNQKKIPLKQNHPCTPKNNLPLSLSKNKLSNFKSDTFSSENQVQNQRKIFNEPSKDQRQKQNKSKIGFSPQKLKQKLIGRNDRKSIQFINENLIQNQNGGFDLKVRNKLDKKIYF